MKVLLLYQYLNHTPTVSALSEHLKPEGVDIECLDIQHLNFVSGKEGRSKWIHQFYTLWIKYSKIRRLLVDILRVKYILNQIRDYDVIDIHSYSLFYNMIIPFIQAAGKPIIIMIWGSDFYRASERDLEKKRIGFDKAAIIHVESESVKSDFLKKFPEYEKKVYVVQFGLNQLDWLKKAMETPLQPTLVNKDIYDKKLIVTCGYNGSKGQQHLKIIEAISRQKEEIKNRIHVIIPFTYGGDASYKQEIKAALDGIGVGYTILEKHLSDSEMVELRRISHIAVNIQITDSFSASIQEHFMAGSVQIIGDWLPYDVFYNQGLYAVTTSIENLVDQIKDIILYYNAYRNKCALNKETVYHFSSWKFVTPKWSKMYKSLL